jgi:anti-sigma B factor antagonist
MPLTLQSEIIRDIVVIRCRGSIITGEEVRSLQLEVEKLTLGRKRVALNLAQVAFIDSGGLGALIRLSRVLRADGGDLVLCELPPFVLQVLQTTTLIRVFQIYESETDAIQSFPTRSALPAAPSPEPRARVICVDTSADLLAFIGTVLKRAGYEVFTSSSLADARTLVRAVRPSLLICGPGISAGELALDKIRQMDAQTRVLQLPPDFSSAEASRTGAELLERVQALLKSQ